jgi:hypothetical protein
LARALDLHSRGHRFDSDILHKKKNGDRKRETGGRKKVATFKTNNEIMIDR